MRFRKAVWRDGNHMLFESGHKTFDRQVDCISTGNIIGNVQLGFYIRSYAETKCSGQTFPVGHLRDFDLENWQQLPSHVRERVLRETTDKGVWLCELRHWRGEHKIVHGYILTTDDDHRLLARFRTGPTYKSDLVIDEAITYVTAKEE